MKNSYKEFFKVNCSECNDTGFRDTLDERGEWVKKLCECTEPGGLNGDEEEEEHEIDGMGVLVRV